MYQYFTIYLIRYCIILYQLFLQHTALKHSNIANISIITQIYCGRRMYVFSYIWSYNNLFVLGLFYLYMYRGPDAILLMLSAYALTVPTKNVILSLANDYFLFSFIQNNSLVKKVYFADLCDFSCPVCIPSWCAWTWRYLIINSLKPGFIHLCCTCTDAVMVDWFLHWPRTFFQEEGVYRASKII